MGRAALICCSTLPRQQDGRSVGWSLKACTFDVDNNGAFRGRGEMREFSSFIAQLHKSGSCDVLAELAVCGTGGEAGGGEYGAARVIVAREAFVSFARRLGYPGDAGAVYAAFDIEGRGTLTVGSIRAQLVALEAIPSNGDVFSIKGVDKVQKSNRSTTSRASKKEKEHGESFPDSQNGHKKSDESVSTRSSLHDRHDVRRSPPNSPGRGGSKKGRKSQDEAHVPRSPGRSPGKPPRSPGRGGTKEPRNSKEGPRSPGRKKRSDRPDGAEVDAAVPGGSIAENTARDAVGATDACGLGEAAVTDAPQELVPVPAPAPQANSSQSGEGAGNDAAALDDHRKVIGPPGPGEENVWAAARSAHHCSTMDAIGLPALDDDRPCVLKPLPYRWGHEDDDEPRSFIYKGELIVVPMLPIGPHSAERKGETANKVGRGTGWQKLRSNVVGGALSKLKD